MRAMPDAPTRLDMPLEDAMTTQRAIRQSPRDPSSAIYYGVAAYAQFVGRNYQEAIALARAATRQRGDLTGAYRVLTVAAGMTGHALTAPASARRLV